jgi:hypothetical protein
MGNALFESTQTRPLILTLKMDRESFSRFEGLRQAHFPPHRNFIPAHLTLFHHLPGDDPGAIGIYQQRLGQPAPSLEAIAGGRWPVYMAMDADVPDGEPGQESAQQVASYGKD